MASRHSKKKRTKSLKPPPEIPVDSKDPVPATPIADKSRLWVFRLLSIVLIPLLFFGLLEIGLQLVGYGYPVDFFIRPESGDSFITNEKFGWRFFSKDLSRRPMPEIVAAKPDETIRIFILGGSAAQGVPEPSFGFGRILETMLRNRYPDQKFEVFNAAVTAINSNVVLEIAKDCADHQPDLFVVYMGNNEVVGPYGPGTVFQKWTPSLRLIRANLWVKSMKMGQFLENIVHSVYSPEEKYKQWRGMEMFADKPITADDPRMETMYNNFRQNLEDICNIGRQTGTPIILSTVAVNLKDCPPFASQHRDDISEDDLKKWESFYQAGVKMEKVGQWSEALEQYESAARLDDRFAEQQYRIGRCLVAEDRIEEARENFSMARNLDVLRFRADTNINRIIREVAEEHKTYGVYSVDAENMLASGDSYAGTIPGEELFFEHVHFKFYGNYLLARTALNRVETALPQLAVSRKQNPDLTAEECKKALALTPGDEHSLLVEMISMMSTALFTNQLDHEKRISDIKERVNLLEELSSTPEVFHEARMDYEALLKKIPDDWTVHHRYGNLLYVGGEYELAYNHLNIARNKYPWLYMVHLHMGDVENKRGRESEAIAHYRKSLEMYPDHVYAHVKLAVLLSSQGNVEEAVTHYRSTLELDPYHEIARLNLANRLVDLGYIDEGVKHFQKILEIYPENFLAYYGLGYVMSRNGRAEESLLYYRKALEIEPHYESARINLGSGLIKQGEIEEAVTHFRYALKDNPGNVAACLNLARSLDYLGNNREAIVYYRRTLQLEPQNGMVHYYLGVALIQQGYTREAGVHFREAVGIDPSLAQTIQSFLRENNLKLN